MEIPQMKQVYNSLLYLYVYMIITFVEFLFITAIDISSYTWNIFFSIIIFW